MSGAALSGAATIGAALAGAERALAARGVESPRRDARLLVGLAAGLDAAQVLGYPERPLDPAAQRRLAALLQRRMAREPMARLIGRREFWSLDFALTPETLDPRPDSETLIEAALAVLPDRTAPLRLLDLGTGSGCLLLALLSELPNACGFGVDIAPGAAVAARRNAAALGLGARAFFYVGAWASAICGGVDVILANPPYIPSGEIAALAPEVAGFEPRAALDGGADGLDAYRALVPEMVRLLRPGGWAFFELGAGRADAVAALCIAAGLAVTGVRRDLGGIDRCLVLTLAGARPSY